MLLGNHLIHLSVAATTISYHGYDTNCTTSTQTSGTQIQYPPMPQMQHALWLAQASMQPLVAACPYTQQWNAEADEGGTSRDADVTCRAAPVEYVLQPSKEVTFHKADATIQTHLGDARKELTRKFMACRVAPTQTVSSKHGTIAKALINPPARASLKACWLDWVGRWCLEGQTTS
ncbi:hypothetical protein SeMB42_g03887 [Synchytrium endobioticum]|uniref:Uncharacterized protein n=1 Tax=Synchytrium endobioticum TaxID=286115 RepID=A0A507D3C2_9FUNG|nr:hypothetical protein SeMB42_g03887 [Synchytrium endobioticum]